ncbi:MAG TPA: hypothetical protein VFT55_14770 [Planctomycetota bacterium]|nr:hypothetical protein [Planctomycetota bacterium]
MAREVQSLLAGGVLPVSRRQQSHTLLGVVDWQLLVLFAGLFVCNHAFPQRAMLLQASHGCRPLATTLAGNLLLVQSIANLIVVEQATRLGVRPQHRSLGRRASAGVPITLLTLAIRS